MGWLPKPPAERSPPRWSRPLEVGLVTFAILALELALIRWMSGQIRLVAYFTNIVLLAAFLGMGLGVALGRRWPRLVDAALPLLAVLATLLAGARQLGLMNARFPDLAISLWATETTANAGLFVRSTLITTGLFWLVAAVFALVATPLGWMFGQLPPLRAYTADLLGSLAGVVVITLAAAAGSGPPVWLALGVVPMLWFSRRAHSWAAAAVVIMMAAVSIDGAIFSPYNRIDLKPLPTKLEQRPGGGLTEWELSVNRDFHQLILDLAGTAIGEQSSHRSLLKRVYELPFQLGTPTRRALVVGAGTGNDVAGALRRGFDEVVAVEIDPAIVQLGRRLHPERPYQDSRVHIVVDDARAYLEQAGDAPFDVVCYGLLDSHAMFSAMSSLRLDNFVYTREGLRAAWQRVGDQGALVVSFSVFAGEWMTQRMFGLVAEATGRRPLVVHHGMNYGSSFIVTRGLDGVSIPLGLAPPFSMEQIDPRVRIPEDDWPFLYLRPDTIPWAYLAVLSLIVVTATLAVRSVYGPGIFGAARFHPALFFMGTAFMLLETRMVTELSLLFGSTWVVNASVFGGILVMALFANLAVSQWPPRRLGVWCVPLAVSLLVTWGMGAGVLNQLSIWERGLLAGLIYATPVAFAGMLFSALLRHSADPAAALGSNLLGAVVGGTLEYSSMFLGLRAMALLALGCYLTAFLFAFAGRKPGLPRTALAHTAR